MLCTWVDQMAASCLREVIGHGLTDACNLSDLLAIRCSGPF